MTRHVSSPQTYLVVYVILVVLLAATVGLGMLDLGLAHTPVALGIALVKAALVALYFMHLRHATPLQQLAAMVGLFWLGIMIVLTSSDYITR